MNPALSPLVIGIGGGTGSGKTTLARGLRERYGALGVSLLDQDSYYRDQSHLCAEEQSSVNYDAPAAVDHDLLVDHLERLARGHAVLKPRYCFVTHARRDGADEIQPTAVLLLEGLFALWDPRVRALTRLKIYVDADPDLRFIRRLRRDVVERGRTIESVATQYLGSVRPMHRLHVEPTKAYADLVLDGASPLEELLAEIDRALAPRWRGRGAGPGRRRGRKA